MWCASSLGGAQWSFVECLSVMAVSGLQVFFIKRMFNKSGGPAGVRRMV
jgi:hypothetical protein